MIKKLWLNRFRNFSDTLLDLSDNRSVVILGKNNQGKTNLLESLFFMIHGKSPRESVSEHLIQFESLEALMGASIDVAGHPKKLYVRLHRDGHKIITLDETVYKSFLPLKKQVNLAYLSADIIRIIQESPGTRRSFLDDFLIGYYPAYGGVLKKYKSCISQKNKLLKQGGDKQGVDVWNQSLVALSCELVQYRVSGCKILTETLTALLDELDLSVGSDVRLIYTIPRYTANFSEFISGYRLFLEGCLSEGMMKEFHAGYSLYGPHRDDFSILVEGRSLFHFFSRGINRMMAILLTLAGLSLHHNQSGAFPILLLDDTFAELDSDIKKRLLLFVQSKTQLFYATVLPEDTQVLGTARVIEVESGVIKESIV